MSIHEELIKDFEANVLAGKKKLSEHERLMFRSGIAFIINWQHEVSAKHGFDGFIEKQFQLRDENGSFARELSKLHAFYCENCQNDIPHGQA